MAAEERFVVGRFQFVDWPNPGLVRWWDDLTTGTRVYVGLAADDLIFVALGRQGATVPQDLSFAHPTHGGGTKSGLAAYLDAVRASANPDWRGIGLPDDAGAWQDPQIVGLSGTLARYCTMFDPKTPI